MLKDVRLTSGKHILVLSGGGQGNEGDHSESKKFWGTTILDNEDALEEDLDF